MSAAVTTRTHPIDLGVEHDRPDQSPGDGASDGSAVPHAFAIDVIDVARATVSVSTPSFLGTEEPTMRVFALVLMFGNASLAVQIEG